LDDDFVSSPPFLPGAEGMGVARGSPGGCWDGGARGVQEA
jgi:hypothetical protein